MPQIERGAGCLLDTFFRLLAVGRSRLAMSRNRKQTARLGRCCGYNGRICSARTHVPRAPHDFVTLGLDRSSILAIRANHVKSGFMWTGAPGRNRTYDTRFRNAVRTGRLDRP